MSNLKKIREQLNNFAGQLEFTRRQAAALVILALLMVVGGLIAAHQSQTNKVVFQKKPGAQRKDYTAKKADALLFVHVAGRVARPGLYSVRTGSRVNDAVQAAGGPLADAALELVNLAAPVRDGQKIVLPTTGTAPPASTTPDGAGAKIDINNASSEQLEGVNGIGPVIAARIIEWRDRRGPFTNINQLDLIEGIGPKKLAQIKKQVDLGQ